MDGVEEIVEVVRDAARENPQGLQPLGVEKLLREGLFLRRRLELVGDVAPHQHQKVVLAHFDGREGVVQLPHVVGTGIQFALEAQGAVRQFFGVR